MKCGSSCSLNKESFSAGQDAAQKVLKHGGKPEVALVFMTGQYEPGEVIKAVLQVLGPVQIAGLCTGGVIYRNTVHTQGVALLTIGGEELFVQTLFHRKVSQRGYEIGKEIGWKILNTKAGPGTVLLFPDGAISCITELIEGLYDTLGPDYKYFGGGSGNILQKSKSYQFSRTEIDSNSVVTLFLSGAKTSSCLGHGWNPASHPVVITCSEDNRVYEIDGYPAFEAYKKRFPEIERKNFTEFALYHPLGFPDIWGNYCLRDALVLHADDSIDFTADIPNNLVGSFMECEMDNVLENAEYINRSVRGSHKRHDFILACSSISRYILMKEQYQKELDIFSQTFSEEIPFVGFLSSGEIGALKNVPYLYNKTLAVLSAGE